jgi:hypothetical protein
MDSAPADDAEDFVESAPRASVDDPRLPPEHHPPWCAERDVD